MSEQNAIRSHFIVTFLGPAAFGFTLGRWDFLSLVLCYQEAFGMGSILCSGLKSNRG